MNKPPLAAEIDRLRAENERLREAISSAFYLPKTLPELDASDWYDEAQVILRKALQTGEGEK